MVRPRLPEIVVFKGIDRYGVSGQDTDSVASDIPFVALGN